MHHETPLQSLGVNSHANSLDDAKTWGNSTEAHKAMYDRNHPKYPYKSHGQWLKACYGMVACIILVIFNGIGPFLEDPFDMRRFIASYIGVRPILPYI